ncbi:DNA primase DnaG, partial [Olavius sp. associated proteobacterium Delta 1]
GKSYFGLCPFHDDTNPSLSVNPNKNLWQCFGCGAGGDVIRFVELIDKVTFPEAVNKLEAESPKLKVRPKTTDNKQHTTDLSVKERKLLGRVVSYYQHTFTQDSRGINYLTNGRGITDNQSLKDFAVGYVNGTLLEILPEDPDVIKALKRIGILNPKGHEIFYNCVVFPLYNNRGSIVNLYGRNIEDDNGVSHLYLPG